MQGHVNLNTLWVAKFPAYLHVCIAGYTVGRALESITF